MRPDLCALVRADHDDLDRALVAMAEPTTSHRELDSLLEIFRLALAVHVTAEARVLDALRGRLRPPRALALVIAQVREEHALEQDAADALLLVPPGSGAWYERVLELRALVIDHSSRAELLRWTLEDHVPVSLYRELASSYATERMRVLATTSPITAARAASAALMPAV
jgi:hypothetical protein